MNDSKFLPEWQADFERWRITKLPLSLYEARWITDIDVYFPDPLNRDLVSIWMFPGIYFFFEWLDQYGRPYYSVWDVDHRNHTSKKIEDVEAIVYCMWREDTHQFHEQDITG